MPRLKLKENGIYTPISPDFNITVHQMPQVSSVDEGKFARVNSNGEWTAATIFQAEDTTNYEQDEYLMSVASFMALNNLANAKAGTTGNHTLTWIINTLS